MIDNMEEQLFGAAQGWQCPICKRVYSPFVHMCMYCGGNGEISYTTSTNTMESPQEQKTVILGPAQRE